MRDEHCHILWNVDDGSSSWEETLSMLDGARSCGFDEVVCTPHMRWDDFDRERIERHFAKLADAAPDIRWTLGFEVFFGRLARIGLDRAREFAIGDTDEVLLEFNTGGEVSPDWERQFYRIQSACGLDIVLAHPERYSTVWNDFDLLYRMRDMGVRFQVSAGDALLGRFSPMAKYAKRIVKEGLCSALVSDAHEPGHYAEYRKAAKKLKW